MSLEKNPTTGLVVELFGPTVEYLTSPDDERNDFCAIADELIDNFNVPEDNWEIFASAEGAERFLKRHGWQAPEEMEMVV